jgi:hypothetical protein
VSGVYGVTPCGECWREEDGVIERNTVCDGVVRHGGVKHGVDRTDDGVGVFLDSVYSGEFDGTKVPKPSSCGGPGSSEKDDDVESDGDGDAVVCEYCLASVITYLTNG